MNRAYLRGERRVLPDGGWSQESSIEEVHLREEDLRKSLIEVLKSIRADAVEQFRQDLDRFCDGEMAESISQLLRPMSGT